MKGEKREKKDKEHMTRDKEHEMVSEDPKPVVYTVMKGPRYILELNWKKIHNEVRRKVAHV